MAVCHDIEHSDESCTNAVAGDLPGSPRGEQLIREEIMPPLEKLMQDEDVDVRFFATTAAKAWSETAMET